MVSRFDQVWGRASFNAYVKAGGAESSARDRFSDLGKYHLGMGEAINRSLRGFRCASRALQYRLAHPVGGLGVKDFFARKTYQGLIFLNRRKAEKLSSEVKSRFESDRLAARKGIIEHQVTLHAARKSLEAAEKVV